MSFKISRAVFNVSHFYVDCCEAGEMNKRDLTQINTEAG